MSGIRHRNQFEAAVHKHLGQQDWHYEALRLPYVTEHTYLPDFVDPHTRTIVEAKGRFTAADRRKMLAVKRQHPDWCIVIMFQNAHRRISAKSSTTYAHWCSKHGIAWMELPQPAKSTRTQPRGGRA